MGAPTSQVHQVFPEIPVDRFHVTEITDNRTSCHSQLAHSISTLRTKLPKCSFTRKMKCTNETTQVQLHSYNEMYE